MKTITFVLFGVAAILVLIGFGFAIYAKVKDEPAPLAVAMVLGSVAGICAILACLLSVLPA